MTDTEGSRIPVAFWLTTTGGSRLPFRAVTELDVDRFTDEMASQKVSLAGRNLVVNLCLDQKALSEARLREPTAMAQLSAGVIRATGLNEAAAFEKNSPAPAGN